MANSSPAGQPTPAAACHPCLRNRPVFLAAPVSASTDPYFASRRPDIVEAEYLFPISYRLTTRGAYANCFLSRLYLAWPDVKRARYGDDGVFLSPLLRASRLDTFRGVRLCFADTNNETVLETVRRCRQDFGGAEETGK